MRIVVLLLLLIGAHFSLTGLRAGREGALLLAVG
jgi:hypothetical protein